MSTAISRLLMAAELAARGAQLVQQLRKAGNNEAASVLEAECTAACKQIVAIARRRRAAASRARKARRDLSGRFN